MNQNQMRYYNYSGQAIDSKLDSIIEEAKNDNFLPQTPRHVLFIVVVQEAQRATRECVKWWGDVKMGAITQILVTYLIRQTALFINLEVTEIVKAQSTKPIRSICA
jgi:hypothetical protein